MIEKIKFQAAKIVFFAIGNSFFQKKTFTGRKRLHVSFFSTFVFSMQYIL